MEQSSESSSLSSGIGDRKLKSRTDVLINLGAASLLMEWDDSNIVPNSKSIFHAVSVTGRCHQVLFWSEITSDEFKAIEKRLSLYCGLELFQLLFPFSNYDMIILDAVVFPFSFDVLCLRKSLRHNGAIQP